MSSESFPTRRASAVGQGSSADMYGGYRRMKLYCNTIPAACRVVLMFCKASNINVEVINVNMVAGKQNSKEMKEISDKGSLPVLVDGDFVLNESHAILRYLVRKKELWNPWYPQDAQGQSRVDELLVWEYQTLGQLTKDAIFDHILRKSCVYPSKVKNAMKPIDLEELREAFTTLDKKLEEKEFLTGSVITIADLSIYFRLTVVELLSFPTDMYLNYKRWVMNIEEALPGLAEVNRDWDKFILNYKMGSEYSRPVSTFVSKDANFAKIVSASYRENYMR
eukprot:GFYU01014477.1.p1 GENE.GFYU01014477.1~~GFYU01014477.1.p1  ORF type:complete len:279 (+),score=59.91 GFYU01014477.1:120-956(+)